MQGGFAVSAEVTRDNLDDFTLKTESMGEAAKQCKEMAEKMRGLKGDLVSAKDSLLSVWVGDGRNAFEKQFRLLLQQFSDIIDDTWDMYEEIIREEGEYIQADTDAAKKLDGKDSRV